MTHMLWSHNWIQEKRIQYYLSTTNSLARMAQQLAYWNRAQGSSLLMLLEYVELILNGLHLQGCKNDPRYENALQTQKKEKEKKSSRKQRELDCLTKNKI